MSDGGPRFSCSLPSSRNQRGAAPSASRGSDARQKRAGHDEVLVPGSLQTTAQRRACWIALVVAAKPRLHAIGTCEYRNATHPTTGGCDRKQHPHGALDDEMDGRWRVVWDGCAATLQGLALSWSCHAYPRPRQHSAILDNVSDRDGRARECRLRLFVPGRNVASSQRRSVAIKLWEVGPGPGAWLRIGILRRSRSRKPSRNALWPIPVVFQPGLPCNPGRWRQSPLPIELIGGRAPAAAHWNFGRKSARCLSFDLSSDTGPASRKEKKVHAKIRDERNSDQSPPFKQGTGTNPPRFQEETAGLRFCPVPRK